MIASAIFFSSIRRATRSGTLSLKFFHAMCEGPSR
jgi:hypothetical protein